MKISKNGLLSGVVFLLLGALIAVGPHTIFAVCEPMEKGFMKCHWTAQALSGIGGGIALLGVLLLFISSEEIRVGIQIALLVIFTQGLLITNWLIGVCGGEHMRCHSLTKPAVNIIAIVGIAVGIFNLIWLIKRKR